MSKGGMEVCSDVTAKLIQCTNFAAVKHKDQRRKDPEKTPYINHPIGRRHSTMDLEDDALLEMNQMALRSGRKLVKCAADSAEPAEFGDLVLSSQVGSARKMPDFSSIRKAQLEKMESFVDFSQRRHKCVRKLDAQAVDDDDNNKQAQLKPSAVAKPIKQTGNALSRNPVVSRNTSRPGTPRALSSSRIPAASFHVLKEKNFDARHNVPHAVNSRPSFTKMGNNSRPTPVSNTKPQRITYEQAKTIIQSKKPLAAVKRETERLENRNILKGVRLNRRFELQMQHRERNM